MAGADLQGAGRYFLATIGSDVVPTAGGTAANSLWQVTGASGLPPGTCSHVAVTSDVAVVLLYMNGAVVGRLAASGVLASCSSPLEMGGSAVDAGWLNGALDDVRIYNVALTAEQCQLGLASAVGAGDGDTTATSTASTRISSA